LLRALLAALRIHPFDETAAEMFGIIQAEQRTAGKPIRPLDAHIAAVARVQNLTVLIQDHYFRFVGGIVVENWLT
jgi:predicted nucleic acid-binding protein